MTCETALEQISAALDGELTADEKARLDLHLEQCGTCRALFDDLAAIHNACGGLDAAPPPVLREQIMANLPPQKVPAKVIPLRWRRLAAMAASFVLIVVAAWQLPKTVSQPPQNTDGTQVEMPTETALDVLEGVDDPVEATPPAVTDVPMLGSSDTAAGASPASAPPYVEDDAVNVNMAAPKKITNTDTMPYSSEAYASSGIGETYDAGYGEERKAFDSSDEVVPQAAGAEEARSGSVAASPPLLTAARTMKLPVGESGETTSADASVFEDALADRTVLSFQGAVTASPFDSEVPEPHPELGGEENIEATLFTDALDGNAAAYCGVLTVQNGVSLLNYSPFLTLDNGENWYELPCDAFYALSAELNGSGIDFDLRVTGQDISSSAPTGLVVVLP